jgi:hypothetical protein
LLLAAAEVLVVLVIHPVEPTKQMVVVELSTLMEQEMMALEHMETMYQMQEEEHQIVVALLGMLLTMALLEVPFRVLMQFNTETLGDQVAAVAAVGMEVDLELVMETLGLVAAAVQDPLL